MRLIGFSIAKDFIALEQGDSRFDLHNNFDFQSVSYTPSRQALELNWHRGNGNWIRPSEPLELSLVFSGVYLFKVQERDLEIPFTEDSCLGSLGFMWEDLVTEMRGFTSNIPSEGCRHFIANFMSGFSVKIGAESVVLRVSNEFS